jgi:hypothetical protein
MKMVMECNLGDIQNSMKQLFSEKMISLNAVKNVHPALDPNYPL